jgi:endonuclease G
MKRALRLGVWPLGWLAACTLLSGGTAFAQKVPTGCAAMVTAIGVPQIKGSGADYTLLCRDGYVLAHNNDHKTPDWVVERLKPARFAANTSRDEVNNPFAEDPDLAAKGVPHATPKDYAKQKSVREKRSFDQGHMAPAGDMTYAELAMRQSFYMSNMAPQQGIGLNRHIWADLEALARDWACDRKDIYVISGPIYDEDEPDTLGADEVAVPTAFYKMAYEPRQKRLIAFILPNEKVDKKGKKAVDALKDYITTLAEVEKRAGVRFLAALDTRERGRLATQKSVMWMPAPGCPKK